MVISASLRRLCFYSFPLALTSLFRPCFFILRKFSFALCASLAFYVAAVLSHLWSFVWLLPASYYRRFSLIWFWSFRVFPLSLRSRACLALCSFLTSISGLYVSSVCFVSRSPSSSFFFFILHKFCLALCGFFACDVAVVFVAFVPISQVFLRVL